MDRDTAQESTMPQRAYSYKRVSTPGKQVIGDGLQRQADYAEEIAKANAWCLDDTLRFTDKGRSGFHGANLSPTADLTRFLDLVKRGRISKGSVLIIENIDRLSRQDVDVAYDVFRGLIKAGIWIATKTPERIYRREGNGFMDLMEPIWLMYLAHQESLKKSERVTHAWASAREAARTRGKPINSKPPGWIEKATAGYALIPERATIVRRIARLCRDGAGVEKIVDLLEGEGVQPFGSSDKWNGTYILKMLRSRAVRGEYQPMRRQANGKRAAEGTAIADYYPAVLDEEEWLRVQLAINRRHRRAGRPAVLCLNLFTGMVYDYDTRQRLAVRSNRAHGRKYSYLCLPGGRGGLIDYAGFENALLNTLMMLRPSDVIEPSAESSERHERTKALQGRLTALEIRKQKLDAACADPSQDAEPFMEALRTVARDFKATAKELAALKLQSVTGRVEALAEAQTLTQLRKDARPRARRA